MAYVVLGMIFLYIFGVAVIVMEFHFTTIHSMFILKFYSIFSFMNCRYLILLPSPLGIQCSKTNLTYFQW